MHNINDTNTVRLDKWHDDNIDWRLVVEEIIIVVARRIGRITQIDLDYNADRTTYEYMTPMKTNSKRKIEQK